MCSSLFVVVKNLVTNCLLYATRDNGDCIDDQIFAKMGMPIRNSLLIIKNYIEDVVRLSGYTYRDVFGQPKCATPQALVSDVHFKVWSQQVRPSE